MAPNQLTTLKVCEFVRPSHTAVSHCLQTTEFADYVFHAVDGSTVSPSMINTRFAVCPDTFDHIEYVTFGFSTFGEYCDLGNARTYIF